MPGGERNPTAQQETGSARGPTDVVTGHPGTPSRPAAERTSAVNRIRRFLSEKGVPTATIDAALSDGIADLLVADKLLLPVGPYYTEAQLVDRSGIEVQVARRLWRALGFPDVGEDEAIFTDLDLEAVQVFIAMTRLGVIEQNEAIDMARVIGSSMERIADAQVSSALALANQAAGDFDHVAQADRLAGIAGSWMPFMGRMLEYVWRRHVQAAVRRAMSLRNRGLAPTSPSLAVGFADMVGYTVLTQQASGEELAAVIARFDEVAHDTVTAGGGRVVKMIGDEVMFVADSPLTACRIGLSLSEAYADDDLLSDVRVAIAYGPVIVQEGDYFGAVVNIASRAMAITNPGAITITDEIARSLEGDPEFLSSGLVTRPLRPRSLKGIGRVQLHTVTRAGAEVPPLERWIAVRIEKFNEAMRTLDELRERGERILAEGTKAVLAGSGQSGNTDRASDSDQARNIDPATGPGRSGGESRPADDDDPGGIGNAEDRGLPGNRDRLERTGRPGGNDETHDVNQAGDTIPLG